MILIVTVFLLFNYMHFFRVQAAWLPGFASGGVVTGARAKKSDALASLDDGFFVFTKARRVNIWHIR